jgi:hypothetical protein
MDFHDQLGSYAMCFEWRENGKAKDMSRAFVWSHAQGKLNYFLGDLEVLEYGRKQPTSMGANY